MTIVVAHFGWRGALLLQSAVVLQGCIFSCSFRPLPGIRPSKPMVKSGTSITHSTEESHHLMQMKSTEVERVQKTTSCSIGKTIGNFFDCSLWKLIPFAVFTIGSCFVFVAYNVFLHHQINLGISLGATRYKASYIPTAFGASSFVARLIFG